MPRSTASSKLPPERKTSDARSTAGLPCAQVARNTGPVSSGDAAPEDPGDVISPVPSAAAPAIDFMKFRRSTGSIFSLKLEIRSQKSESEVIQRVFVFFCFLVSGF